MGYTPVPPFWAFLQRRLKKGERRKRVTGDIECITYTSLIPNSQPLPYIPYTTDSQNKESPRERSGPDIRASQLQERRHEVLESDTNGSYERCQWCTVPDPWYPISSQSRHISPGIRYTIRPSVEWADRSGYCQCDRCIVTSTNARLAATSASWDRDGERFTWTCEWQCEWQESSCKCIDHWSG